MYYKFELSNCKEVSYDNFLYVLITSDIVVLGLLIFNNIKVLIKFDKINVE